MLVNFRTCDKILERMTWVQSRFMLSHGGFSPWLLGPAAFRLGGGDTLTHYSGSKCQRKAVHLQGSREVRWRKCIRTKYVLPSYLLLARPCLLMSSLPSITMKLSHGLTYGGDSSPCGLITSPKIPPLNTAVQRTSNIWTSERHSRLKLQGWRDGSVGKDTSCARVKTCVQIPVPT